MGLERYLQPRIVLAELVVSVAASLIALAIRGSLFEVPVKA